ncbi:MAG: sugar transferase, partial [Clostridiales bacterium]|nr:sugar transferase [Clostridiales bacterium]
MYVRLWKRVCDVIGAVLGLVITAPLWLLIALAIKLTSGGPILFWQKRVGRGKATFYLAKFRTMRVDAPRDIPTHLLDNPERHITGVGRLLRRMSIDELPQLINILRGEMSLVGPRP